jgi:hypothetical protein
MITNGEAMRKRTRLKMLDFAHQLCTSSKDMKARKRSG